MEFRQCLGRSAEVGGCSLAGLGGVLIARFKKRFEQTLFPLSQNTVKMPSFNIVVLAGELPCLGSCIAADLFVKETV